MKLLIPTPLFPPDIGGPATYSKILVDELPSYGVEATAISFGEVRHLPKVIRHVLYFLKLIRAGRGVDIIYAQDPVSVGLPAYCASRILRKRFFLKVVGDYAWEQWENGQLSTSASPREVSMKSIEEFQGERFDLLTEVRKKIERFVARRAEKVIVPSEYLRNILLRWGVLSQNIRVIPNSFKATHLSESKEIMRKRFGFPAPVLVTAGRLVPWKGFFMLVDLMKDIVSEFETARLIIIGDGPLYSDLEEHIQKNGLRKHVALAGRLDRELLLQYVFVADLFVLNTYYEGFSHQILEAMALGTPVLTTPNGGNSEIIKDRVEGMFAPFNAKREWKRAIFRFLHNPLQASSLVQMAKEKAQSYTRERMIEALIPEFSPRKIKINKK